MHARHLLTLVLASTMVVGCATAPGRTSEGQQRIRVSAERSPNPGQTMPTLGWGTGTAAAIEPVEGAHCVVSNDRGSWSVTTPGEIEVASSRAPFQVTCKHEGFKDDTQQLTCASRRTGAAVAGAAIGLPLGAVAGAAAVAAGPAVVIAAVTGPVILGGATGYAVAAPEPVCKLVFLMTPVS